MKIEPRYMMATTAIHQLGDISADTPDICRVYGEDDENYIGAWVTGFGFFDVKFPKTTTRPLTEEERAKYNKMYVQLSDNPPYKLEV